MPDSTRTALRRWHGADRFGCTAMSGAFKSERDPAGAGSGFGQLFAVSAFVTSRYGQLAGMNLRVREQSGNGDPRERTLYPFSV
ncbi:hypothetical protein [Saccharibacillus sacchari]|uniref:hypothetical protein n=1 Tax=Saccharibacillus sacchari TaxID=456493 RepID=UPI0004B5E080|nr:hypothetical protein [Saccharibacillus sacchari]